MHPLLLQLRAGIAVRTGYQRLTYRAGTLLVLLGALHVPLLAADGWAWSGSVSWRKPILFGVSLGLAAWSAGWVLRHLPVRRVLGWSVASVLTVASLLEWGLIALQRWRGVASHFNNDTPFDAAVFGVMGFSIGLVTLAWLGLLVWAWAELRHPPAIRGAVLTGVVLLLVASGLGGDLIARGGAEVAATGRVPDAVVIGAAGSGKLAHAVGLHGVQVLGAFALLLEAGALGSAAAGRVMRRASLAYTVGFAAVVAEVYAGRAVMDLSSPLTPVLVVAMGVVAWCGWTALRSALAPRRAPLPVA